MEHASWFVYGAIVMGLIFGVLGYKFVQAMHDAPEHCPMPKRGALLLSLETIETSPRFFSVLALVLRASGFAVYVVCQRGLTEHVLAERAAEAEIPFTQLASWRRANEPEMEKLGYARQLVREHTPVIWPDVDFGAWPDSLPDVSKEHGIVALNWAEVLKKLNSGAKSPKGKRV